MTLLSGIVCLFEVSLDFTHTYSVTSRFIRIGGTDTSSGGTDLTSLQCLFIGGIQEAMRR